MSAQCLVAFPVFIGQLTGVNHVRIGVRKIGVGMVDGREIKLPRKAFSDKDLSEQGNSLAFRVAEVLAKESRNG